MDPVFRALIAEMMKGKPDTKTLQQLANDAGLLEGIESITNRPELVEKLHSRIMHRLSTEFPTMAEIDPLIAGASITPIDIEVPTPEELQPEPVVYVTPGVNLPTDTNLAELDEPPASAVDVPEVEPPPVVEPPEVIEQPAPAKPPEVIEQPAPAPASVAGGAVFVPQLVTEAPALIVIDERWLLGVASDERLWAIHTARAPVAAKGLPIAYWKDEPEARALLQPWKDRPAGVGAAKPPADGPKIPAGVAVARPSAAPVVTPAPPPAAQPLPPPVPGKSNEPRRSGRGPAHARKLSNRKPTAHPAHRLHVEVRKNGNHFVATCEGVCDEVSGALIRFLGSTPAEARTKAEAAGMAAASGD